MRADARRRALGRRPRHRRARSRRRRRTTSSCRRACPSRPALQQIVLAALNRHAVFFSAALPRRVLPPLFNRYGGDANAFGNHVDNAVRYVPGGPASGCAPTSAARCSSPSPTNTTAASW